MGKIGVFVILFAAVFSLAITPNIFDDVFAGTLILPPDPPPPPGLKVILFPAPGALPELPGFPGDDEPDSLLGDFKCYLVGNPVPEEDVFLIDQFEDKDYSIKGITEICNYVLKSQNEDVPFPPSQDVEVDNQHYKVYDIRCDPRSLPTGEECPVIMDDVLLRDQFGDTRHFDLTPVELWVPQEKSHIVCPEGYDYDPFAPPGFECVGNDAGLLPCPQGFQTVVNTPPFCVGPPQTFLAATLDTEIHWKCYEVEPQFPNEIIILGLNDLNFGHTNNQLVDLYKICTPVEKIVDGCPEGYTEDQGVCFNSQPPFDDFPIGPVSFGDSTIDDHLKCYHINPDASFFLPFGIQYTGQFGTHDFFAPAEWEVCLTATKLHIPESAIGGSFIPIDSSALLLLAAQTTASWMIPVLVSAVGIGIVVARKISSKKE